MAEQHKPTHGPRGGPDQAMARLLDPVAWEARVSEARVRRAEALARRPPGSGGAPARPGVRPDPSRTQRPGVPAPARAAEGAGEDDRPLPPGSTLPVIDAQDPPKPAPVVAPDPSPAPDAAWPADPEDPRVDLAVRPRLDLSDEPRVRAPAAAEADESIWSGQGTVLAILFVAGLALGLVAAFALSTTVFDRVGGGPGGPPREDASAAEATATLIAAPDPAAWVPATAPAGDLALPADPAEPAADPAPLTQALPEPEPEPDPAALSEPGPAPALATAPDPDPAAVAALPVIPPLPEALAAALAGPVSPELPVIRPVARPGAALAPAPAGQADAAPRDPDAALPPLPDALAGALAGADAAPAAVPPSTRVLLHVPARAPAGTAESALAALAGAGIVPEGPLRVGMTIERANVRYYFPEDAAAARALSDRIGAATGTPVEARDFTSYRPQPTPGTVEVWLAGQGAPGAARAPAPGPVQIADQIADQTLRDLEAIASEVARALSRSLGN